MTKNNKEKATRIVTFKEDYYSKPGKEKGEPPIYRKGSVHAIRQELVKQLQAKGAKFDTKELDVEAVAQRRKKMIADNKAKALATA